MNKTTALVGIVAGLVGASITFRLKSKDTIEDEGALRVFKENSTTSDLCTTILFPKYSKIIEKCREHVEKFKNEIGIPGVVVGVSVDGKLIWEEGFGYANLETNTPCLSKTAMRIASISKPLTITLLGKLHETKKLHFDDSVYKHVSYFPKKKVDGEDVDITLRQLASHTSGIRHYKKKGEESDDPRKEFYIKNKYENIQKSVEIFKDDELFFKPGTSYNYTTHGYTLIGAAIETAGKKPFSEQIETLFKTLGLENTHLDRVEKLINFRTNYYTKNKHGHIINAELADPSYKWAGGGIISTVEDLIKFANAMLYSYQQSETNRPGYLLKSTVQELWKPVKNTVVKWGQNSGYGLGWEIIPQINEFGGVGEVQKFQLVHTGGAVGASSILSIYPKQIGILSDENNNDITNLILPQGVVIAILVNLEDVSCRKLAKSIAHEFLKSADGN